MNQVAILTDTVTEMPKELTSSRFACAEFFITQLYPLVINHTGLEAFQFSWWSED
jgi:hypothetical protein